MRRCIVVFIAAAAALPGCKQPNEFQPPPPPEVEFAPPIVREATWYFELPGRLEASKTVEIRARVRGTLEEATFDEGQVVEAGQILYRIEREPYQAAVAAAEADLARARANRDLAQNNLDRTRKAFDAGAANDFEVEVAESQLAEQEAIVLGAQAALDRANIDLGYTTITAPMTGRISRTYVDLGNLVGGAEATLLTTIVADDPMFGYFQVPERVLLQYLEQREANRRKAESALLRLADGSDYPHPGTPDFADTRLDPESGSVEIRVSFPNPDGRLISGLFARARVPQALGESVLVPEVAIQRDIVGPFLLVIGPDDRVERRSVELGPLLEELRVIASGLEPDDRVVVAGLQRARPGAVVRPVPAAGDDREASPEPPPAPPAAGSAGGEG
ncbi:MAG: efflux RND transporter periplasmic adaptor subunit [Phycisphaerales bacterium JB039]